MVIGGGGVVECLLLLLLISVMMCFGIFRPPVLDENSSISRIAGLLGLPCIAIISLIIVGNLVLIFIDFYHWQWRWKSIALYLCVF